MNMLPYIRWLNVSEELKSPVLDVTVCWQEFCVTKNVAVPHDEECSKLYQSEKYLTNLIFCAFKNGDPAWTFTLGMATI
jgi:hypothetical protein